MEQQHRNYVIASYAAVAALVGYVILQIALRLAGQFDLEARVHNIDAIVRTGSIVVGAIVLFVLFFNDRANQFMSEVVVELARVTWPTTKETTNATFIVIIMVLISGMILGLLDYLFTKGVQGLIEWIS
jgi:preprotein translocase SecE subunit